MEDKKYNYQILKDQKLIIKYYSGKLTLKDLYSYVEFTGEDTDYLPTMFVLNDIRDCEIVIEDEAILDFIHKIRKNPKVYAQRKIVFLTDTPNQVVFSSMIDLFKDETFIDLNTVSTIERALRCLKISEADYSLVFSALNQLKMNGPGSL